MSLIENIVSKVKSHDPHGEIRVVDRSPLNWLYITYNTVEELIRTDEKGRITPAAMKTRQTNYNEAARIQESNVGKFVTN